jgi:hypothetical protein
MHLYKRDPDGGNGIAKLEVNSNLVTARVFPGRSEEHLL